MLQVRRSLMIKQIVAIAVIVLTVTCLFTATYMFNVVQQQRDNYVRQLEYVARSVRAPLAEALLNNDLTQATQIINAIPSLGVIAQAEIQLFNENKNLHSILIPERAVPHFIVQLFSLPIKVSTPLYTSERAQKKSQPLAYLILQLDSFRLYQFALNLFSTLLAMNLLLTLILSALISWYMNRLLVRPLQAIANELAELPEIDLCHHQFAPHLVQRDDEIGALTYHYNRNQQMLAKLYRDKHFFGDKQFSSDKQFSGDKQGSKLHYQDSELPNEDLFTELLAQYLRLRPRAACFNLLAIEINLLKESSHSLCKDEYGELLRALVERIRTDLPEDYDIGQLDSSRFIILARDIERPFQAMRLARDIMTRINAPLTQHERTLRPTVSIGIAHYCGDGTQSARDLMTNAQAAMMSAYYQGKNQILFFEPELTRKAQQSLSQENDTLQALELNEFSLYLQPQIDLRSGAIVGAEALLRRKLSNGEYSLDADFILNAEEIGVIVPLGYWVLEQGCRILSEWKQSAINIPLSINLSGAQIQHPGFVLTLKTLLSRYQIQPGMLVLEITETSRIADLGQALQLLSELHQAGVSIALDDLGMGYSSLEYLNQLRHVPIDIIKIDRHFIGSLPQDGIMVQIVNSIAQAMGISIVAEGVENGTQHEWLVKHNIFVAQGFLFAHPMARAEFEKMWRRGTGFSAGGHFFTHP